MTSSQRSAVSGPATSTRRGFLKQTAAVALSANLATRLAAEPAGDATVLDSGDETQLFLDDFLIERSAGLRSTLHQPARQGLLHHTDGSEWDRGDVYHGNIVCRDSAGRFHMTYRYIWSDPGVRDLHPGIGDDKAHWFRESVAYATSEDGVHWHKPELGLVDGPTLFERRRTFPFEIPGGVSKGNNLGCPFDFIQDLAVHPARSAGEHRFLLRLMKKDDTHPFAAAVESRMCLAPDWPDFAGDPEWLEKLTPLPDANLSPRGFRSLAGFDERAGEWFVVGQDYISNWLPRGGRDIARFHSPDLTTWEGPELVLPVADDESREPADWIEYMDMSATWSGGRGTGLWLGQLVIFNSDRTSDQYMMPTIADVWRKGTTELRLVTSRDAGRTWRPVGGRQAWLPHHEKDDGYDRLVFAADPLRVGDELWFYYSAWDGDHLTFNRDGSTYYPDRLRIGRTARATLRADGYLSLDADAGGGELVTPLLRFEGERLLVNLSAPRGSLRAELRDGFDRPLPGFSIADCRPLSGDGVALPVEWREPAALRAIAGQAVRLRFELKDAALYSFRFA